MPDTFPCRTHCPINFALESFGDKWTLLIIRDLMFKAKRSFGEFASSAEGISTNILTDRLKRLETLGIISKQVSEQNRSKTVYSLTEKGRDLLPVMLEITRWSGKHDSESNAPKPFLEDLNKDTFEVAERIRARWPDTQNPPAPTK